MTVRPETSHSETPHAEALHSEIAPRGPELDAALVTALGTEEVARWLAVPDVYVPELVLVREAGRLRSALLVTRRPHAAYRKIAGVWSDADAALDAAVGLLLDAVAEAGDVVSVKWEDRSGGLAGEAARLGFEPLAAPIRSGAGTDAAAGYVRYLEPWPHRALPYYRQTTEYSCGPVALLMAQAGERSDATITRDEELRLWRAAAHLPGCGPIGLGLHVDRDVFDPEVFVSTERQILHEYLTDPMSIEVRALVDAQDEAAAREQGLAVQHRLLTVDEIAQEVAAGHPVLLLIDEFPWHGEAGPHWVTVHSFRDGAFLLHDPWIDAGHGESWVDTADIPLVGEDVDLIGWWGDPAYRGALVLRPVADAGAEG